MTDETRRNCSPRAVLVRIHGRVQGVGYRDWTLRTAALHGLAGWVRNRHDGTVEALFCGPAGAVREMLQACNRGPRLAAVERLDVADAPADLALPQGFDWQPTV